eukprot:CAMPEP_0195079106 /NCGR_PEP_ID=MMETSP0448-20130528/21115_1 /TAXON_ID=66468 /ORGANISM="Heterocapsa triquestra, Strain CCMP 448" /LENGTH=1754 /DNA_ID=CAMNT_0040111911 /DNA_START=38 /DNA_END=5302 /DNA_ORIENTATION=+
MAKNGLQAPLLGGAEASPYGRDDVESGSRKALAQDWFAGHLLDGAKELPILDLPTIDTSELLPHETTGVGKLSASCSPKQSRSPEPGANVLVALSAALQWFTRAEGSMVVGVEGWGPLLNGYTLETPVPIRVPFLNSEGVQSQSLSCAADEVGRLMHTAVKEHGPDLGPLGELCARLGEQGAGHHALFQVLVSFKGPGSNEKLRKPDQKPLVRYPKRGVKDAPPLAMVIVVRAGAAASEPLRLRLAFSRHLVSKSFATAALRHVCRLLELPFSEWNRPLDQLPLVGDDEWETVLKGWCEGPRAALDRLTEKDGGDLCLHELFENCKKAKPLGKAIMAGDVDGEPLMLTYEAANAWANDLALKLRSVGVGREDIVVLFFNRSPVMIIAIYAVLKAGGCYCPCDTAWPEERLSSVLEGANPKAALCPQSLEARLRAASSSRSLNVIPVEESDIPLWAAKQNFPSAEELNRKKPSSTDPCYVFFTSGSTGKPKGVIVPHCGVVHRVRWLQLDYDLQPGNCCLLKHAYTFGLSEWEIFWPLSYGASVVTCTPGAERDPSYLVKLFQRHHVPVSVFVPSALQAFLESVEESKALAQDHISNTARQIIACGEPLRPQIAHMAHRLMTRVRIDNVFGPTEGEMTRYVVPRGRPMTIMPVGRPIDGSVVYVLGAAGQLCGSEIAGELHFAGPYIAKGYLSQPQTTAEKFVADPFKRGASKMYKSGDLVRWRGDGELVFVGRADNQVKIRGFRIELGDIESAILKGGAGVVNEVVVRVDASRGAGSERLVAYVGAGNSADNGAAARSLEQRLLKECSSRLPPYMVPALVAVHEKLPRNANGKVDAKALTAPAASTVSGPTESEVNIDDSDLSATEKGIRDTWAEVLKVKASTITLDDNFFAALGGNSLLAGRVTAAVRRKFEIDLPGTTMYAQNTVKKLATQVDILRQEQGGQDADGGVSHSDEEAVPLSDAIESVKNHSEYRGRSATRLKALVVQFFGVILIDIAQDFGPTATVYIVLGWAYYYYGMQWWMPFFMAAASLFEMMVVAVFTASVKWLVLGRMKPGSYPLWGGRHLRWWLVDRFLEDSHNLLGLLAETPLLTAWYRILGANIAGNVRLNHPKILTPDMVEIHSGVEVNRYCTIGCASVYGGMLHVQRVVLGEDCRLDAGSYAAPGTRLPPRTRLLPMATSAGTLGGLPGTTAPIVRATGDSDVMQAEEEAAARFWRQQDWLRMLVGLPWLSFLLAIPYVGSIFLMDVSYTACYDSLDKDTAWPLFWYVLVPIIVTHAYSFVLLVAVILQKWVLIGKLSPGLVLGPPAGCSSCASGAWRKSHWDTLRHWMHERCVTSRAYEHALEPLVNSELLSCVHRMLGAKVGRRVQSDNFKAVEHDCIQIEDFVVFGSAVTMSCDASLPGEGSRRQLKKISLQRASNCLDHSQLMPGVVVGEAAVLGTRTLAQEDACFPPDSISTGAIAGRSVLLRTDASSSTPAKDRALELKVMNQLENPLRWFAFNFAQCASAFVAYCLPQFAWVLASSMVMVVMGAMNQAMTDDPLGKADKYADREEMSVLEIAAAYWFVWLAAFLFVEVGLLLLACLLKWVVMGTYKEENFTFFSNFHYRWAIMLNFKGAMAPLGDHLSGTAFQIWYYRLMGAKIGKNAYLSGIALEFDLLHVGNGAAINDDCDATAHTVERMVLKMAPVILEDNSAILPGSVVMPGGRMEQGALLLERSQVLKGDTVRAGEIWAGQPAQRIPGSKRTRNRTPKEAKA